jgi:cell division protein FtsQ
VTAAGEPTDRTTPRNHPRWLVPAAVAAGAFVLLLMPFWAPALLRRMDFFRVRHVEVVGVRYVQARDIVGRLGLDSTASVWDDPEPLEARVARHPLVADVRVGRKLPGTLLVRLVEHAPVALVSTAAGFRAYDARGVALPIDLTQADVNAPILSSAEPALLRLLARARTESPGLYRRMSEIRREGAAGDLRFILDSIPVLALRDITLQRLADIELVEQDLARRKLRAVELDLRYRDQVIARLP